MNRSKQEKQVREFNKAFNIACDHDNPMISEVELKQNMYLEELEELKDAIKENDLVGVFDALIDSVYIHIGLEVLKGVSYPITLTGTHSNDAKLTSRTKIAMTGYMNELVLFIEENDISDNLNIQKMSFILSNLIDASELGMFFVAGFDEVHRSNMSKLSSEGKPLYFTEGEKKGKVMKSENYFKPDLKKVLGLD